VDDRLMSLCSEHTQSTEIVDKQVIEIGSYNVNGSFRQILEPMKPTSYVGETLKQDQELTLFVMLRTC